MNPWLVCLLLVLAVHRITHFLTQDAFPPIADLRAMIVDRWGVNSWQAYLSECSWCVGVYVAAAVVGTAVAVGISVPLPFALALAASSLTGLLSAID